MCERETASKTCHDETAQRKLYPLILKSKWGYFDKTGKIHLESYKLTAKG